MFDRVSDLSARVPIQYFPPGWISMVDIHFDPRSWPTDDVADGPWNMENIEKTNRTAVV
jgi:hypothetical protein